MESLYYDRQGNPISQWEAARLLGDFDARLVAQEYIRPGLRVSTVHLALNHGFDPAGPPLIFETMVFEDGKGMECWRWSTEAEAIVGHRAVVDALRAVQKEEQPQEEQD